METSTAAPCFFYIFILATSAGLNARAPAETPTRQRPFRLPLSSPPCPHAAQRRNKCARCDLPLRPAAATIASYIVCSELIISALVAIAARRRPCSQMKFVKYSRAYLGRLRRTMVARPAEQDVSTRKRLRRLPLTLALLCKRVRRPSFPNSMHHRPRPLRCSPGIALAAGSSLRTRR